MARAWINDRWVKDAIVELPDGSTVKVSPTAAQLRAIKTLPDQFRTTKHGKGSRWLVGWYEPGGKQRQKLYARRVDAEAFVAGLEDDIRSDRYIDPSARETLFRDVAEKWLASKNRVKEASVFRYRSELDRYVLPKWGDWAVGSIGREDIDEWVVQLREGTAPHVFDVNKHIKHKVMKPRPMSPAYLKHVVRSVFGSALRYAVGEKWIGSSPLERVELPRDEGDLENDLPSLSYTTIEELAAAALELTGNPSDPALVHLLASSGPRIGEASAFKVKDLDLPGKRARVHRTWTLDRSGKRKLGAVKTWEKRWLPLADHVVGELTELVKGRGPEEYVFRTGTGTAVNGKNWYNRVWVQVKRSVGITTPLSVHDLRHVAATNAIAAGADVKLVQRMLGHKDATETLNTYAHLWPDRVADVISAIDEQRTKALKRAKAEAERAAAEAAQALAA